MKYIGSRSGAFLIIGLYGPDEECASDRALASNLFGTFDHDDVFKGRINFTGWPQFMRFLIYKEYFKLRAEIGGVSDRLLRRHAAQRARKTLVRDVKTSNFMRAMGPNANYYQLGEYQDESEH